MPAIAHAVTVTFTLDDHTVTFDANGGTGTMTPQVANVPTALTLNAFTRTGYTFAGWDTVAVGGGDAYADGATYDFSVDVTLYAQWTALPSYNVTVSIVGSGVVNNTPGNPYLSGTTATLEPVADLGWTFSGWSGANAGELTDNLDGTWDLLMDGDKAVTATFTVITYSELLTNTSFETYIPTGWQDGRQIEPYDGPDCGTGHDRTGNCAVHFEGDGSSKRIFMRYKLGGVAGDNFMLSIYRKGANVPVADGAFVKATFFYKDGTQEVFKVNLDTGNLANWEQFTLPFSATKDYKRVNLDLFYKKASGTMWLDDFSLLVP